MKNTSTAANTWTFAPDALTVNGRTFPASYSLARTGDVYVFATVKADADAAEMPVRLHISATMPMHADAVAAAEAARAASKASKPAEAPAPVQEVAPVVEAAPVQETPAPVQDAPADKPAPAKKPRKPRKASKPAEAPAPVQEVAPAQEAAPAPVQDAPAPVQDAPAGKACIGTAIQGKGWSIAFDAAAGRTRVQVEGTPTDAQRSAIEQAGFYWSAQLNSWNKKLTCKAYRAAQALASTLNALA